MNSTFATIAFPEPPDGINEYGVLLDNRLMRQFRVRRQTCTIREEYSELANECYGKFNDKNQDTAPFGSNNR